MSDVKSNTEAISLQGNVINVNVYLDMSQSFGVPQIEGTGIGDEQTILNVFITVHFCV
jgi:hypothetical protein